MFFLRVTFGFIREMYRFFTESLDPWFSRINWVWIYGFRVSQPFLFSSVWTHSGQSGQPTGRLSLPHLTTVVLIQFWKPLLPSRTRILQGNMVSFVPNEVWQWEIQAPWTNFVLRVTPPKRNPQWAINIRPMPVVEVYNARPLAGRPAAKVASRGELKVSIGQKVGLKYAIGHNRNNRDKLNNTLIPTRIWIWGLYGSNGRINGCKILGRT